MITIVIILTTAVVSVLAFSNRLLFDKLRFNPYTIQHGKGEYFRFLSYSLLHADWMHLGVNMYVLYSFGSFVETSFGVLFGSKAHFYYMILYIGSAAISVVPAYIKHKANAYYTAVGASGAVSAVVFSSIVLNPTGKIGFMFLPFALPSVIFGVLYIIYSAYMNKRGADNIGHDAHLWGAVFGVVFTLLLKPSLFNHILNTIGGLF